MPALPALQGKPGLQERLERACKRSKNPEILLLRLQQKLPGGIK